MTIEESRHHVILRADGSPLVGGGHLMRSLSLANAFRRRGWSCSFAVAPEALELLHSHDDDFDVSPVGESGSEESEAHALQDIWPEGCSLLVVDHYGRGSRFETAAKGWACRVLAIEDLPNRPHVCDFLVEQSPGQSASDYEELVPSDCEVLVGADYALLRPQFILERSKKERTGGPAATRAPLRTYVGFGLTDTVNLTPVALRAIDRSGVQTEVDVVLGSAAPHISVVEEVIERSRLNVVLHIDPPNVAELMARSTIALGAAGSTSLERCCLGLPTIAVVVVDNQLRIAEGLARAEAAEVLGWHSEVSEQRLLQAFTALVDDRDRQQRIAWNAWCLCDGKGQDRVAEAVSRRV